jgi:hypothetical protein
VSLPLLQHEIIAGGLYRMAGGCENAGQHEAAACLEKAGKIVQTSARKDAALEEADKIMRSLCHRMAAIMQESRKQLIEGPALIQLSEAAEDADQWLALYGKEGE